MGLLSSHQAFQLPNKQQGFTLIETLVAFMILSIALVIVLQLFSGSMKSLKISNDYERGVFHAKEKMESVLMGKDLSPGEFNGDFGDGYQWQIDIATAKKVKDLDTATPLTLFNVRVKVDWQRLGRKRIYQLKTQALAEWSDHGMAFN